MIIYISLFLICFALSVPSNQCKNSTRSRSIVIIILLLTFISGFRYDVGTDYIQIYVQGFNRKLIDPDYILGFEIGFRLLNQIIIPTKNYLWVFLISAIITNSLIIKSIYELNPFPFSGIMVYLLGTHYLNSYVYVRQYIGIAIFIYALKYLEIHKYKKYIISILIASSFHISLLLCLSLLLLRKMKIDRFKTIMLSMIAILILASGSSVILDILNKTRYGSYLFDAKYKLADPLVFPIIICIYKFGIMYIWRRRASKIDDRYNLYYNLQFLTTVISISSIFLPMIRRVIIIFMCADVISVGYMTKYVPKIKTRKILTALYIVVLISYTWYTIVDRKSGDLLPYTFIFNKEVKFY